MENRKPLYSTSRLAPSRHLQIPHPLPATPPVSTGAVRPLSDIHELSEPSLLDYAAYGLDHGGKSDVVHRKASSMTRRARSKNASECVPAHGTGASKGCHERHFVDEGSSSYSSTPGKSSPYAIPYSSIPRRSSSRKHAHRSTRRHNRDDIYRQKTQQSHAKLPDSPVPYAGHSSSPLKNDVSRQVAFDSLTTTPTPQGTHDCTAYAKDILAFSHYRHPRVKLELKTSAPLFVGGGSIEGQVKMTVDGNTSEKNRRSLAIGSVCIDLVGFEEISNGRKATFLALGNELVGARNPPPSNIVQPPNPLLADQKLWTLMPSTTSLPFLIRLPLDTGHPPFQSKSASIRFLLCATVLISDAGKHYRVRTSQDVNVLPTYDPEKALASLPSPFVANDQLSLPRYGRCETLKLVAGLHRQVWVSGNSLFVDILVANKTFKPVKRMELNLERNIFCYKHAAAEMSDNTRQHARNSESHEQAILTRTSSNPMQQGWNSLTPYSSETRTCKLDIPHGHATVHSGKYCEVRFFLNIIVSLSRTRVVSVQLPITLVHMNSLDVLPNSVAQVAAAMGKQNETKHYQSSPVHRCKSRHRRQPSTSSPAALVNRRRRPSYSQGRAFAAPIQQSIELQKAASTDIDELRRVIDSSPRKYRPKTRLNHAIDPHTPSSHSTRPRLHSTKDASTYTQQALRPMRSFDATSRFRFVANSNPSSEPGLKERKEKGFMVFQKRVDPFMPKTSSNLDLPKAGTDMDFRERMDKKRFEFTGVRKKESGSLREKGKDWLERLRNREREQGNWI